MKKTKRVTVTARKNTAWKMTPNRAAALVRHEIRRKMAELDKDFTVAQTKWDKLREYVIGMAKRASKKVGGLGTK